MAQTQARRELGATGSAVAVIGEGTWNMERDGRRGAIAAIQRAVELGLDHIDTAELYGDGAVEEIVGEALAGRRERLFLASKVHPGNASRKGTIQACERSLRRLRTDHLDLYLLHWPGDHPLADTIAAFEELSAAGKIRCYGVSNFDEDELDEAVAIAGPGKIACNQVFYHLGERAIEHRLLPRCQHHQVAMVGYSPFGSGEFPSPRSSGGAVLAEIASELGATARQVALAFLTREPGTFTIPKASHEAHVTDNAGAVGLPLSDAHVQRIDAAFPRRPWRRGVPMI